MKHGGTEDTEKTKDRISKNVDGWLKSNDRISSWYEIEMTGKMPPEMNEYRLLFWLSVDQSRRENEIRYDQIDYCHYSRMTFERVWEYEIHLTDETTNWNDP